MADEVGLGKTIEAGLVISQRWAERKRRILVITPSNLRKQWLQELQEKFFLPCRILETRSYNQIRKADENRNPFESGNADDIVICSYHFARNKSQDVRNIPWDLVVIDEAATPPEDEQNFTLQEATSALACLSQGKDCDLLTRLVRDFESLWSLEEETPDEPSRYERVFHPERQPRTVWRAVQTQRVVTTTLREHEKDDNEVRKVFAEHSRWLILNLIFLRLKPEQGDEPTLPEEMREAITNAVQDYADLLWTHCGNQNPNSHSIKTLFGSAHDCTRLRGAMLAALQRR